MNKDINKRMKKFQNQSALTIITKVKPEKKQSLIELFERIVQEDVETNSVIPFKKLSTIHFARFAILDKSMDIETKQREIGPLLLLSTNYDSPLNNHLNEFVRIAGSGLDEIYSHCEGYPDIESINDHKRLNYLKEHMKPYGAFYNGSVGLSVKRINEEEKLRQAIETFIDEMGINGDRSGQDVQGIRETIKEYISTTEFKWALTPPDKPPLSYLLLRGNGWKTAAKILFALPFVILPLPIWLIILVYKEGTDKIFPYLRYNDRIKELAVREDKIVQNQMTIVADMKPGTFRLYTLKSVFAAIELLARYWYTKGKLGSIPTIHFARWVFVDDDRSLLFLSNYGGSWESYLGDFIDKASTGLTGVWTNTVLFPKTRLLLFEGATDEQRFKVWARWQQIPTNLWYSAYPTLTIKNIINNKEIRKGLSGTMTNEETRQWLRRL
jgi:hypothetical protein